MAECLSLMVHPRLKLRKIPSFVRRMLVFWTWIWDVLNYYRCMTWIDIWTEYVILLWNAMLNWVWMIIELSMSCFCEMFTELSMSCCCEKLCFHVVLYILWMITELSMSYCCEMLCFHGILDIFMNENWSECVILLWNVMLSFCFEMLCTWHEIICYIYFLFGLL